jgi:molybdenum cofactor sulfurtransferase
MGTWFGRQEPVWPDELRDGLFRQYDRVLSAVRVSLGIASNFADVYRFACFLQNFVDRTTDEITDTDFITTEDSHDHKTFPR